MGEKGRSKIQYFVAHYPGDPKYWNINPKSVDGVLISQKNLFTKRGNPTLLMKKMLEGGVHKALDLPDEIPVMMDSGAFQYIGKEWGELPVTQEEVLENYRKLGANIGVHLDWPITKRLSEKQVEIRYKTTIENAEIMSELVKSGQYGGLKVMAVTQGLSPSMHRKCAIKYVELGYKLIGIGGLAPIAVHTDEVMKRVDAVVRTLSNYKDIKMHLFGVGNFNVLKKAMQRGIFSFDNATPTMAAIKGDLILCNPHFRRFNILKNPEKANSSIPCGCEACKKLGVKILSRGKREWNFGRAVHNYVHYKQALDNCS